MQTCSRTVPIQYSEGMTERGSQLCRQFGTAYQNDEEHAVQVATALHEATFGLPANSS